MSMIYKLADDFDDKSLLGNKGANLVTMTKLGLAVPPGFVVSIEAYREYKHSGKLPMEEIERSLQDLEQETGKSLGKGLTVSVRSSAPVSMPGMMDTILDVKEPERVISSIKKVFDSADNVRAIQYRRLNRIPSGLGTAAIVQAMVYGDLETDSGTGVLFTRNPSTGEKGIFGEFLTRAQGEDLVSGQVTPQPLDTLRSIMPDLYTQLEDVALNLENHFGDMQDVEFTIEAGRLYILQTRAGKRSGGAAVKIAVDMSKEGLISTEEAIMRVSTEDLRALLHQHIESPQKYNPLASGLAAAPGAAVGMVVFDPFEAVEAMKKNEKVILVRPETSPDDIQGVSAAVGVLTSRGGLTSHAAIVTRAMGKPCICGADEIKIDIQAQQFEARGQIVKKGEVITIDGNTGNAYLGSLPLVEAESTPELADLLAMADSFRHLQVRANADSEETIALARKFGAEGIGLCRTERQFNDPERLYTIREFILAETTALRSKALGRLYQLQKEDFITIFRELQGMSIVVRLLDLPLHEFLPSDMEMSDPELKERIHGLRETNPMLGHRGVRLAITSPEIYQMQIDAISEARDEVEADVSIMVPQVITLQELLWVKRMVKDKAIKVGIMMETVRACMRAGRLAQVADFFSFGTNDLTQAVYSFSREDVEKKFLSTYLEAGILRDNPFQILDEKGVGRLMETAISWARKETKGFEIGVCGEHAGEPRSIKLFHNIGVDYVSCSPFRIPIARLAAAQAAIEEKDRGISEETAFGNDDSYIDR
ncbi:MAG: pyruvate, phosphate dikinase [Dehalococcoidia bacterium]|nr:pyruvate, phosphate dikinase [Dehalococcoidia bacterium]